MTAYFVQKTEKAVKQVELASPEVALDYDRCLHPLLESIIVRMRRYGAADKEVLLDADRRPPPVLKAKTADEFRAATDDKLDPFGWLMLDRLGLGVTLRLFDPLSDTYLDHRGLRAQFTKAVNELRHEETHADALRHLTVDWLLRPGQLLRVEPFAARPGADGFPNYEDEGPWLQDASLSMLHISVRPRIKKRYAYRVKAFVPGAVTGVGDPVQCDAMRPEDSAATPIASTADLDKLVKDSSWQSRTAKGECIVFMRYTNTLSGLDGEDLAPGVCGDEAGDAFGRFPVAGWGADDDEVDGQFKRFWLLLSNSIKFEDDVEKAKQEKAFATAWLNYNQRFFEHSSAAPSDGQVTYAYAATESTQPVLVAPDVYGRATVTLPEADGYAHQFAYVVRPQWRYRAVLETAGYAVQAQQASPAGVAVAAVSPPYVIGTVARTAPVVPPALISLGRIGDRVWWKQGKDLIEVRRGEDEPPGALRLGSDAGLSAALLLPHHPERRLARANVPAQRNLSHAGELYTQVSMLVDPGWCEAILGKVPAEPPVRVQANVGDDQASAEELDTLADPLLPFERTRLRLVSFQPHWYRNVAVVAAASGTEVSVPAVGYLPQAASRLVLIDRKTKTQSLVKDHPWRGRTVVDASGETDVGLETLDPTPHAAITLAIPLLRYRDTTDDITASLWEGDIATVPDPGVSYQIDLIAPARPGEPRESVTPIARIVREEVSKGDFFRILPISRDWQLTCEMTVADADRALKVTLSPLGRPLRSTFGNVDFPGVEHDADGALRAPGGWSIAWLSRLLEALGGDALETAVDYWRDIEHDGVGVADDETGFYEALPAASVAAMKLTRPTTPQEWTRLKDTLAHWQLVNGDDAPGIRIANLVLQKLARVFDDEWPLPQDDFLLEIPWLTTMDAPDPVVVPLTMLTAPRFLLPELMTREDFETLTRDAPDMLARAEQLWKTQKQHAMGAHRVVVTAQRGDAVPLRMLPLQLV
ncbi:hypothetical protein WKW77_24880 [Variovorax ureilyticus]|uniref:Phage baseplate assembly protein n=1 Tax=Variovorax ureilyticus TaxID=1836198 RepID=A0ABU8VL20_9BURK